jgi:hypothetical protein
MLSISIKTKSSLLSMCLIHTLAKSHLFRECELCTLFSTFTLNLLRAKIVGILPHFLAIPVRTSVFFHF